MKQKMIKLTGGIFLNKVASGVQLALEQLQSNDGVDDDEENYQEEDVKQWHHGRDNWIENNLQTCEAKKKSRPIDSNRIVNIKAVLYQRHVCDESDFMWNFMNESRSKCRDLEASSTDLVSWLHRGNACYN